PGSSRSRSTPAAKGPSGGARRDYRASESAEFRPPCSKLLLKQLSAGIVPQNPGPRQPSAHATARGGSSTSSALYASSILGFMPCLASASVNDLRIAGS